MFFVLYCRRVRIAGKEYYDGGDNSTILFYFFPRIMCHPYTGSPRLRITVSSVVLGTLSSRPCTLVSRQSRRREGKATWASSRRSGQTANYNFITFR